MAGAGIHDMTRDPDKKMARGLAAPTTNYMPNGQQELYGESEPSTG